MTSPRVQPARLPDDLGAIEALLAEYLTWAHGRARDELGVVGAPGSTDDVAADLDRYLRSPGAVLVGEAGGIPSGLAVVRTIAPTVAEVKRMFVSPSARGRGLGGALLDALIAAARDDLGARVLRLDTASFMDDAGRLYRSRGFTLREAYPGSEIPAELQHHWRFYELPLDARAVESR